MVWYGMVKYVVVCYGMLWHVMVRDNRFRAVNEVAERRKTCLEQPVLTNVDGCVHGLGRLHSLTWLGLFHVWSRDSLLPPPSP